MRRARVIPVLLLKNRGLYKTIRFKNEKYIGDPINAVRIFNEKLCDELIFLDILASKQGKEINYQYIEEIASECFMPFAYGGGINEFYQIEKLLKLGIEKVILNTILFQNPSFLNEAASKFGSSTIVVSVDVKMNSIRRPQIFSHAGCNTKGLQLLQFLRQIEEGGAGEVMINVVENDGLMNGYDYELANLISSSLSVPVVFCGGCKDLSDITTLLRETNVSAAAAGSFFLFHGPHKGILINYPSPEDIGTIYNNNGKHL